MTSRVYVLFTPPTPICVSLADDKPCLCYVSVSSPSHPTPICVSLADDKPCAICVCVLSAVAIVSRGVISTTDVV